MAERSGFFNAQEVNGAYDRIYDASDFAKYFSMFIGNGVFADPASQLMVLAKSGRSLTVKAGNAFIDGYWYTLDEDMTITIAANTSATQRTDAVCCTLDKVNRKVSIVIRQNATTPRNDGSYHDLVLATVVVGVSATNITNANISDMRPYKSKCGFVKGLIDQIDTTNLFTQFRTQFDQWFDNVKNTLSGDVAANLQSQVNDLRNALNEHPTIRSGTALPSNSLGEDGDIYIRITG